MTSSCSPSVKTTNRLDIVMRSSLQRMSDSIWHILGNNITTPPVLITAACGLTLYRTYNPNGRTSITGDVVLLCLSTIIVGWRQHAGMISRFLAEHMFALLLLAVAMAMSLLCFSYKSRSLRIVRPSSDHTSAQTSNSGNSPSHPWLIPARTTHSRMFPKKHSFSYSYLQIVVPVAFEGRIGNRVSVGQNCAQGWFHLAPTDYLERTSESLSLQARLHEYLLSQGVARSEWNTAYLVTAPRFLGYAFNPVSFWYIYDHDDILSMMILEVNNTFDERRMYLCQAGVQDQDGLVTPTEQGQRFKQSWSKDFHVSPFNSRKGSYSLSALNSFADGLGSGSKIDNTIVLHSSQRHVKLIARLYSIGKPIDPKTSSWWSFFQFVCRWFWVGFLTSPRILKEAGMLFFKQRLHLWLRPEIMPSSIGRTATPAEICFEQIISKYLQTLVEYSTLSIELVYRPNLPGRAEQVFDSRGTLAVKKPAKHKLIINVLSPAFYSRFVHYRDVEMAFNQESVMVDERNRTAAVSDPVALRYLLDNDVSSSAEASIRQPRSRRLQWQILRIMRCDPSAPAYEEAESAKSEAYKEAQSYTSLDLFVQQSQTSCVEYQRHCIKLFFAERYALGQTAICSIGDMGLRLIMSIAAISTMDQIIFGGSKASSHSVLDQALQILSATWQLGCLHLWALLK